VVYATLDEWRAQTGQESLNGRRVGFFENPRLARFRQQTRTAELVGLAALDGFRPLPDSPALTGGIDLRGGLGNEGALFDLLGEALPASGTWPLGALSKPARD
jgi:hypothetical protein